MLTCKRSHQLTFSCLAAFSCFIKTAAQTPPVLLPHRDADLGSDAHRRIALACLVSLVPRLTTVGSPGGISVGRFAAAAAALDSGSHVTADGLVAGSVPNASDDMDAAEEGIPCGEDARFLHLMCVAMVRIPLYGLPVASTMCDPLLRYLTAQPHHTRMQSVASRCMQSSHMPEHSRAESAGAL